jgi:hypothetical protein
MLIFGLPDLSSNDRIIMLSLIYLAWGDEEPLQISMRDLAKFNHISPSVLCDSAKSEQEKQKQITLGKFREGSLTRLSNLGYITVEEIDGKTYITVHLQKIWDDNAAFRKTKGVPNSNTIKSKGVRKSNTCVLNSNTETTSSVLESNRPVLNSNTDDLQAGYRSDPSDPLRTNNNFNERMKERESTSIDSENETSNQTEASFHSSIHSIQSSPKPRKMGLIQAVVREVLRAIRDERPEGYHFDRVHDLWLQCDIEDIKTFREKIYAAKTKTTGHDIEHFYRCLCSALHLEQAD